MTDSSERFKQRKLAARRVASQITPALDDDSVQKHLKSEADHNQIASLTAHIDSANQVDPDSVTVSPAEVDRLIAEIHGKLDQRHFQALLGDIRRSTLQAITGPLGLGYAVSGLQAFDAARNQSAAFQPGAPGNKTVIVLSCPGRQEERAGHPAAGGTGRNLQNFVQKQHLRDPGRFPSPDLSDYRIVNAWDKVEAHGITGRSEPKLSEVMDPQNLTRLGWQIGDARLIVSFGKNANAAVDALKMKVERMRGIHPSPLSYNSRYKSKKAATEFDDDVNASRSGSAPKTTERARVYGARAASVGAGMAKQQVISAVVTEFTMAMFDELGDCWQRGLAVHNEGMAQAVARRAKKVCLRILTKWKVVLGNGVMGWLSGFLSELTNILIGTVKNVGSRLARIVREGIASLLSALRMVLFPSGEKTPEETWHEATKLMAAGILTAGGITLEGVVAQALPGFDFITGPVVSIITGLAIAAAMYGLDKLDLFGAMAARRHAFTLHELDQIVAEALDAIDGPVSRTPITPLLQIK